jgi:hypothetical protein
MSVTAKNAVTKRATRSERRDYRKGIILIYSGINVPILWSEALRHRYQTHQWLTYKQALDSGAQVRKGEKSITVVFASQVTVKRRKKKSAAACCEHITCSMLMRTRLHDFIGERLLRRRPSHHPDNRFRNESADSLRRQQPDRCSSSLRTVAFRAVR